jgi:hypothetical protein
MMKMKLIPTLTLPLYFDGGTKLGLSEWKNEIRKKKNLIKQNQGIIPFYVIMWKLGIFLAYIAAAS